MTNQWPIKEVCLVYVNCGPGQGRETWTHLHISSLELRPLDSPSFRVQVEDLLNYICWCYVSHAQLGFSHIGAPHNIAIFYGGCSTTVTWSLFQWLRNGNNFLPWDIQTSYSINENVTHTYYLANVLMQVIAQTCTFACTHSPDECKQESE